MFRRSNSSSNIPLLKVNLFGVKDSKTKTGGKRSQSSSRLSQRDSGTSIGQRLRRNSSLDRKSSTAGFLRTPLCKAGVGGSSLQKTTPTPASQRTSSSRGTTPSSCRKDHITIQKLSTNKKWVGEQYKKVQNFIMSSGLFDTGVVDSSNIKPPSINNFIYVTNILLMEIFPRVKINKENYKEVIPAQLKVIRYPGTLTTSVLKTVNTMHSWPQIIGMWSWLIDKVSFCKSCNDNSLLNYLEPEERTKYLLKQNCVDYLIKRYKTFNGNKPEEEGDIDKMNEEYVKRLAELLEVDIDKFRELQDTVEKKKKYRNKQEEDIQHLREQSLKVQSDIDEMKKEIEEFQESDPITESELNSELQILQSNLKDQQDAIEAIKETISQLHEAIKVQPCTYQEKLRLLHEIEELKKEIQVKREKIDHAREIKNKFDHKLTAEISKIQSLVIQWNRSLMEVSIMKPHLKKLLLREKGFHDPLFLSELQEVFSYKTTAENEIETGLITITNCLKEEEQKKCEVERIITELNDTVNETNKECLALSEKIAEIEKELANIITDLESKKVFHTQQLEELQNMNTIENQLQTIAELEKNKNRLVVEVTKFGPKMLSFFVEMHNQVVANLKEMETIKKNLSQKKIEKMQNLVKKQRQMIQALSELNL